MEEKDSRDKAGAEKEKGAKSPADGKEPKGSNPDVSVLKNYSPTEGAQSHPDWVKKKFPEYLEAHGKHEDTSVREITHNGHNIKIITTYRVEVDGKPATMHLSVDEDGQVYTHATPFITYASAVDLMKEVMDAYPDAFSSSGEQPDHSHGENHDPDPTQGGGRP
jgi:hypothetical protein